MNERLRELVRQAGLDDSDFPIEDWDNVPLAKFAELVVRECIDIASEVRGEPATDTHYVIGYDRACEKMINGIKEHFGVEE